MSKENLVYDEDKLASQSPWGIVVSANEPKVIALAHLFVLFSWVQKSHAEVADLDDRVVAPGKAVQLAVGITLESDGALESWRGHGGEREYPESDGRFTRF